jgi:pyruvate dehydrogenase E2 component (dihydrolipoamide acetyltransferase)
MARAIEKRALTAGSLLLLCVLIACKKKDDPAPAATVSSNSEQAALAASAALAEAAAAASAAQAEAAPAAAPPAASSAQNAPVLGDVKRFSDKEKPASGSVKVTLEQSKVYNEPDATKPSVASLPKDLVVTRLATLGADWVLVEFPSGVGKVSPGWLEAKSLASTASTRPATSASAAAVASAKPATSAVASAVPTPSASAPKVRVKPSVLRAPSR